jgi:hypothetical protein
LDIVALVLWTLTGAVGVVLLTKVSEAARRASASPDAARTPVPQAAAKQPPGSRVPPPLPHVKVTAARGEHPLLEFSHPLIAFIGLACWFAFVFVHYQTFASVGLIALIVAIAIGVSLLVMNSRERVRGARSAPLRLIMLHGLAAAMTLGLAAFITLRA